MKLRVAERLKEWIQITQFLYSLSYHPERVNFHRLLHGLEQVLQVSSYLHTHHTHELQPVKETLLFLIARAAIWQVVQRQPSPAAAVQGPRARWGEQENVQCV